MRGVYKSPKVRRDISFEKPHLSFLETKSKPDFQHHGLLCSLLLQRPYQPRHHYLLLWQILQMWSLPTQHLPTHSLVTGANLLWQLPPTLPHSSALCAHLLPAQLFPAHPRPGNHQPHNLHSAQLWALHPKLLLTNGCLTQCLTQSQPRSFSAHLSQYLQLTVAPLSKLEQGWHYHRQPSQKRNQETFDGCVVDVSEQGQLE